MCLSSSSSSSPPLPLLFPLKVFKETTGDLQTTQDLLDSERAHRISLERDLEAQTSQSNDLKEALALETATRDVTEKGTLRLMVLMVLNHRV